MHEKERRSDRKTEGGKMQVFICVPAWVKAPSFPPTEIQISKIMQNLTQFTGSREIHRGYGKNTDGRQASKRPLSFLHSSVWGLTHSAKGAPFVIQTSLQRKAQERETKKWKRWYTARKRRPLGPNFGWSYNVLPVSTLFSADCYSTAARNRITLTASCLLKRRESVVFWYFSESMSYFVMSWR